MIKVRDGVRHAAEKSSSRQVSICGEINPRIKNQSPRPVLSRRSHDRHRRGKRRVAPADSARVRQRRKIIAIEPSCSRPPQPLRRLVEIEMMLSKVLARQDSCGMAHRSRADLRSRGRYRRRIQHRQRGMSAFLLDNLVLIVNPAPESPRPATPASHSIVLFPKRSSRFFVRPSFSNPLTFWRPSPASRPYSISNTPDCTDSAVVENVGRFGTAVI